MQQGVDGMLTLPTHRGRDRHSEKHAHVYRHLVPLALAVTAAHSARTNSGPGTLRAP
jgi:hypothetical protein